MTVSLKRNVIANGVGQGWRALMSLAFVPLYIKYVGIEAYGLIGIFAMLQSWLTLFDMGIRPALGREMARFSGGAHDAQSIRNLLRSVEVLGACIAGIVALCIWRASGWLASDWLRVEKLPLPVVARALTVMGIVTSLRFIEDIYVNCLAGLELQVEQNVVICITSTARGLGAVAILAWISPTLEAFFIWQALISVVTVALFSSAVYRALPKPPRPARFSLSALRNVWRFAAGVMAITCLALLLSQTDKILLSRLLTLKVYGYYTLAGTVANGLAVIAAPINAAFYPRFTALTTLENEAGARLVYHQSAQLMTVLMGSAAVVLIVFRDPVMMSWTRDPSLVSKVAPLMAALALGTLLNVLVSIPYQVMLAHGWTGLTIKVNTIAVAIFVPAILWIVPRYGAMGAACIWVVLNTGYVVFVVSLMHRRLMSTEKWRWYRQDVGIPLLAAVLAALLCRSIFPDHFASVRNFFALAAASIFVLISSALAAPATRGQIERLFPGADGLSKAA